MRRGMSRTPPAARARRSATPVRRRVPVVRGMSPPSTLTSPEHAALPHVNGNPVSPWASPITAPEPTRAAIEDGPLQEDACALCQQPLHEVGPASSDSSIWRFPCRCRMRMHLACMLQLRMRCHTPPCMHCRDPWPGESADELLLAECHRANLPIQIRGKICQSSQSMTCSMVCPPDHKTF